MRVYLIAIRDEKIGAFMQLGGCRSEGEARRTFADEVNREAEDNLMRRHPQDFALYAFGWFDSESGSFELHKMPELLVNGSAVYVSKEDGRHMRIQGVN